MSDAQQQLNDAIMAYDKAAKDRPWERRPMGRPPVVWMRNRLLYGELDGMLHDYYPTAGADLSWFGGLANAALGRIPSRL